MSLITIQSSCVGQFLAHVAYRGTALQTEKVFILLFSLHSQIYNYFSNNCSEAFQNMQSRNTAICIDGYSILFSILVPSARYFKYSSGRKIVMFSLSTKNLPSTSFSLSEIIQITYSYCLISRLHTLTQFSTVS